MGRGKVTLKYIQNEKDRKISFDQRMEGLTKKVAKFSSDFGIEPCLIVYNGDDKRPMTLPQDFATVQTMLKKYVHQKIETAPKIFDVRDYFENKKNIAEEEITRVRKKIARKKYRTWSAFFKVTEEEKINVFIGMVDAKIQACNQRINMLKNISAHNMDKQEKIDVNAINEDWLNQLIRLDDRIKELHKDYINGIVDSTNDVDLQQGETSFMLNTTQEKVISSHSSQHDVSSINQIDELFVLEDFLMAEPEPEPEQELDPQLCGDILLELEHLIDGPHVPSTKQLGEILEFDNLVALAMAKDEAAKPKDGDTEVIDFNDNLNWVSQPDVFANQGLSFLSNNQQH